MACEPSRGVCVCVCVCVCALARALRLVAWLCVAIGTPQDAAEPAAEPEEEASLPGGDVRTSVPPQDACRNLNDLSSLLDGRDEHHGSPKATRSS